MTREAIKINPYTDFARPLVNYCKGISEFSRGISVQVINIEFKSTIIVASDIAFTCFKTQISISIISNSKIQISFRFDC